MIEKTTTWYEFTQNDSGGYFVQDDKVCHRLFIEANSFNEAMEKAEELGCYFNGVDDGIDCPCCGDRWDFGEEIDIEKYKTEGYKVQTYGYGNLLKKVKAEWEKKYRKYEVVEEPMFETGWGLVHYTGTIRISSIEEYAQILADEYDWTTPDIRIYYKNGEVKEIFTEVQ